MRIRGRSARPSFSDNWRARPRNCGFESIWTVEHVVDSATAYAVSRDRRTARCRAATTLPIPDPLIPLAYAAAITSKIKLATGIVILPQRHPLYLAKQLATIDLLSQGRMLLGIGSGWMKEEFEAVDVDYHARGARTDESIQAMRALWSENPTTFHGKHFHFHDVKSLPKPVQAGGIPIHVGGHSPAAARRAGRFGDGFFPTIVESGEAEGNFRHDARRGEAGRAQSRRDRIDRDGARPRSTRSRRRRTSASRAWSSVRRQAIRRNCARDSSASPTTSSQSSR